jgi:cold shock CspA family protein
MPNGTVANYLQERAFGFIKPDDRQNNIFFHVRNFPFGKIPEPGMCVAYDIGPDSAGRPMAINIRLLNDYRGR